MVRGPGRDQREPMERIVRMAAVLRVAGSAGVPIERLAEVAGFTGDSRNDQVAREVRQLSRQGWQIENIASDGESAVYRMTAIDNRLRVRLTPAQQRALQRAALLADRDDLVQRLGLPASERPADVAAQLQADAHDATLDQVATAVRHRSLLRYRYNGKDRVVHPQSVRTQNGTWYLEAREDGDGTLKNFVVSRMSGVTADPPGTAQRDAVIRHAGLHPMSWEIDPAIEVTVATSPEFAADVRRLLGEPTHTQDDPEGGDGRIHLTYRITHRSALRTGLYELGRRVSIVGPEEIRGELLAELAMMAGRA